MAGVVLTVALLGSTAAACIAPRHATVAEGQAPGAQTWTVTARVKTNGSCHEWLFEIDFDLPGSVFSASAIGIPAGARGLSKRYFGLHADEWRAPESMSVLDGFTDIAAVRAVAEMSDGSKMRIEPEAAPPALRQRARWLRIFRYFVVYFPDDRRVLSIRSFDQNGNQLARKRFPYNLS